MLARCDCDESAPSGHPYHGSAYRSPLGAGNPSLFYVIGDSDVGHNLPECGRHENSSWMTCNSSKAVRLCQLRIAR